jgi:hypothetical protein
MANRVLPATAFDAVAVTKSDSTVYDPPLAGLFIGGAGNVAVVTEKGNTVTFTGCIAGQILPITCTKVMSTNTTATNINGFLYA